MKSSKVASTFTNKLATFLPKLKETSTIGVAHDQIRKLFSEFKYSDIALAFTAKMDSCDQLTEKQKRQYSKVYLTLMEVYGQDVILEHYERFIESLAKKTIGVSQVINQLCKTLLNRIYPVQNIANYIQHLLQHFEKHLETGKIIKQIVESFDCHHIAPFQLQIMSILGERLSHCRHSSLSSQRCQILDAIMCLILVLQQKFELKDTHITGHLIKLFKNQDYNTRKLCVDIAYSLLVITKQVNPSLHEAVKELKYDKIKHVRDSVTNYNLLYKQLYESEESTTTINHKVPTSTAIKNKTKQNNKNTKINRYSHQLPTQSILSNNKQLDKSLDKSVKINRNQDFFQNAQNRDIIKTSQHQSKSKPTLNNNFIMSHKPPLVKSPSFAAENLSSVSSKGAELKKVTSSDNIKILKGKQQLGNTQINSKKSQINFEQYLKEDNRSPIRITQPQEIPNQYKPVNNVYINAKQINPQQSTTCQQYPSSPKNMLTNTFIQEQNLLNSQNTFRDNSILGDSMMSFTEISNFKEMFRSLENKLLSRIDGLENRMYKIQKSVFFLQGEHKKSIEQSFEQKFNQHRNFQKKQISEINNHNNISQYQYSSSSSSSLYETNYLINNLQGIESNLDNKIKQSLLNNNWDQAFSIVLANGKKGLFLQLLKPCKIPQDKLVLDCVLLEVKKSLHYSQVLKWFLAYLHQCHEIGVNIEGLQKVYNNLQKVTEQEQEKVVVIDSDVNREKGLRNYRMLKGMVMNQIMQVIKFEESILKRNMNNREDSQNQYRPRMHF